MFILNSLLSKNCTFNTIAQMNFKIGVNVISRGTNMLCLRVSFLFSSLFVVNWGVNISQKFLASVSVDLQKRLFVGNVCMLIFWLRNAYWYIAMVKARCFYTLNVLMLLRKLGTLHFADCLVGMNTIQQAFKHIVSYSWLICHWPVCVCVISVLYCYLCVVLKLEALKIMFQLI